MFAILTATGLAHVLGEIETLGLLVACLCHDLDHRGTNNSFQVKSCSPLAQLYSTSVMERHHFDQCLMILSSEGNRILDTLSTDEYRQVTQILEEAILATDIAEYFKNRGLFYKLIEAEEYDVIFCHDSSSSGRRLLRGMLMTACDIAAITKPVGRAASRGSAGGVRVLPAGRHRKEPAEDAADRHDESGEGGRAAQNASLFHRLRLPARVPGVCSPLSQPVAAPL